MMTTDSTFKIGIYEQVAEQMNKAHIVHCAAHGIDYRINHYGRDVDVMIRYQDRSQVRRIIKDVFENNGICYKINKFSWADWIIGYKKKGDELSFIEIDLFYHIYYRMIELTDSELLGVSTDLKHFYIADWNTYAKVVLLKFYGLNLRNLSSNQWKEVQRCAALQAYPKSNMFKKVFLESLNDAIGKSDFKSIEQLKNNNLYWSLAINSPIHALNALKNMIIAVIYRKLRAFHIIPVIILPNDAKPVFKSFSDLLQKESFICAINESTTESNGFMTIFRKYLHYRHYSTPLSLNMIYTNRDNWKRLQRNILIRFLNVRFMDKDVDACKILKFIIK